MGGFLIDSIINYLKKKKKDWGIISLKNTH